MNLMKTLAFWAVSTAFVLTVFVDVHWMGKCHALYAGEWFLLHQIKDIVSGGPHKPEGYMCC